MTFQSGRLLLIVPALLGVGAAPPPPAQQAPPQALLKIERGHWELRAVGDGDAPVRLCLGDRRQLFQPHHPAPMCRQFVSADDPEHATVSYDCDQRGRGLTELRVETSRLVQISSQGVTNGRPFVTRLEGRHIGVCPGH